MIEFLKNIKSKIGIYHLEDDAISIGKILKISGKYLFLDSYDSNNKKEGIKVFLISEIKRVILKSDYIEKLYCTQNLGHKIGGAVSMSKLTRKDKIEIYERNKKRRY